jgi:hypothetical protein
MHSKQPEGSGLIEHVLVEARPVVAYGGGTRVALVFDCESEELAEHIFRSLAAAVRDDTLMKIPLKGIIPGFQNN